MSEDQFGAALLLVWAFILGALCIGFIAAGDFVAAPFLLIPAGIIYAVIQVVRGEWD